MNGIELLTRVSDFVRQHPGLTVEEIARGVRAAHAPVRALLCTDLFVSYGQGRPGDPKVYRLSAVGVDGKGRAARRSQCSKVAGVLADGRWHSTAEIHRRCGFSRLNSRVAELRSSKGRWGMLIDARRIPEVENGPDAYEYRFVGFKPGFGPPAGTSSDAEAGAALPAASVSPGVSVPSHGDSSAAEMGVGAAGDDGLLSAVPGTPDCQLELGEAA